ncbi:hypothetical protein FGO68_gene7436 [Halteria grandinella]|uniref:RING-type domain-containing protein n=1 Tax=Halteria grandinella TaxID=5974 RepID=A0A8J8NY63_HALGN|nr:hypothetical protein FGO68_gene7436 [Halteria grandinella]
MIDSLLKDFDTFVDTIVRGITELLKSRSKEIIQQIIIKEQRTVEKLKAEKFTIEDMIKDGFKERMTDIQKILSSILQPYINEELLQQSLLHEKKPESQQFEIFDMILEKAKPTQIIESCISQSIQTELNLQKDLGSCSICQELVNLSEEYIVVTCCNSTFHRICLIHHLASATDKRFFLTPHEIKTQLKSPFCLRCKKGYNESVMLDLLKDRAQGFQQKMIERLQFDEINEEENAKEEKKVEIETPKSIVKQNNKSLNGTSRLKIIETKPKPILIEKQEILEPMDLIPRQSMICQTCEDPTKKFDLKKYILSQSNNQLFQSLPNGSLVLPSCACDFSEPIPMHKLTLLFGESMVKSQLWKAINKEEGICEKCFKDHIPVASIVVKDRVKAEKNITICERCFDPKVFKQEKAQKEFAKESKITSSKLSLTLRQTECDCEVDYDYIRINFHGQKANSQLECRICFLKISQVKIQHSLNRLESNISADQSPDIDHQSDEEEAEDLCCKCGKDESLVKLCITCSHQCCVFCIDKDICAPITKAFNERQKLSYTHVSCPHPDCDSLLNPQHLLKHFKTYLRVNKLSPHLFDKLDQLFEPSPCCRGHKSFLDQCLWLNICTQCTNRTCIVCANSESMDDCECIRCKKCLSANLVRQPQTKSYLCPSCMKHYCERCREGVGKCRCYEKKNQWVVKKGGKQRRDSDWDL